MPLSLPTPPQNSHKLQLPGTAPSAPHKHIQVPNHPERASYAKPQPAILYAQDQRPPKRVVDCALREILFVVSTVSCSCMSLGVRYIDSV